MEFFSTEYAENFTKCFSGSLGDQNGPQLIVDGRAVMIDFATPRSVIDHSSGAKFSSSDSHRRGDRESSSKGDWLCETVCNLSTHES